ncbi:flavonol sulfotransferase-like isoform X1 [Gossypium australe]|uniref:Sulfotransferase n=1 Tax=Gossypium australe TaxID=47621 RepID=A0A5B6V214_9ROSI|nr:flavonol sulfotransferase-like isoform X1 [Gossypium australe]
MLAQQQFEAQPTDIILCSAPRTGTAWLKSLTFATITRTSYDDSTTPLLFKMPHDVVPFMELDHTHFSANRHLGIPLLATHAPYSFLPTSIIDSGCVNWYGPYWDHVLGYWKASLEHPDKFMFLKYEEMNEDTVLYLKKLAEFMGCPFSSEEQQKGMPEKIVKMCSFENIINLEVNKSGKHREGQGNLEAENKIYFRKGKVGDWKDYLTPEMSTQ